MGLVTNKPVACCLCSLQPVCCISVYVAGLFAKQFAGYHTFLRMRRIPFPFWLHVTGAFSTVRGKRSRGEQYRGTVTLSVIFNTGREVPVQAVA